jgi:hypothetical protein
VDEYLGLRLWEAAFLGKPDGLAPAILKELRATRHAVSIDERLDLHKQHCPTAEPLEDAVDI